MRNLTNVSGDSDPTPSSSSTSNSRRTSSSAHARSVAAADVSDSLSMQTSTRGMRVYANRSQNCHNPKAETPAHPHLDPRVAPRGGTLPPSAVRCRCRSSQPSHGTARRAALLRSGTTRRATCASARPPSASRGAATMSIPQPDSDPEGLCQVGIILS
eukprot:COSAG01_NODE_8692_length_2695_cov_4.327427_3_plen_158_part_00